ncbi:MAG: DHH family phosphoesterase [Anaerolineales bacterium]|jgi:nanoRNase/pAp phosphatase (c-di-AMP/oligoRNAs hydrolase)
MPHNRIEKLRAAFGNVSRVLILPHNDPDPDAIASALGLRYLLAQKFNLVASVAYKGFIGRAENRALVGYLGNPLIRFRNSILDEGVAVALVDTQPGVGNHPLPERHSAAVVIDHHGLVPGTETAQYADVRPEIGSTSSILTEYLIKAGVEPSKELATALFYGIKTDTMGLSRHANVVDISAYFHLQPKIDVKALGKIEQAQVPLTYFKSIDNAMHSGKIFDNDVLITYLGKLDYPDKCAEIADFMMRMQGITWVFCMGVFRRELILSARTISEEMRAGKLVREIIKDKGTAGGHGAMAAGHIELTDGEDPGQVAAQLEADILLHLRGKADIPSVPVI